MAKRKRSSFPETEDAPGGDDQEDETTEGTSIGLDPPPPETVGSTPAPKRPEVTPVATRLGVFLRLAGRNLDQLAGFAAHARLAKLGPMPVVDWRRALADFDRQPAG